MNPKPHKFPAVVRTCSNSYCITIPSLVIREMITEAREPVLGKTVRVEVTL